MLEVVDAVVSILNLLSTWRFVVAILGAASIAFLASRFIDDGPFLGWMVWVLIAIGAAVGLLWQYRHEKSGK
jgi:hypothetical protein